MDKLFNLLEQQPAVSIICIAVLTLFLVWILRHQIVAFVKKRYDLYDKEEIKEAFNLSDHQMYKLRK